VEVLGPHGERAGFVEGALRKLGWKLASWFNDSSRAGSAFLNQEVSFRPSFLSGFARSGLPRPERGGGGGGASGNTGLWTLLVDPSLGTPCLQPEGLETSSPSLSLGKGDNSPKRRCLSCSICTSEIHCRFGSLELGAQQGRFVESMHAIKMKIHINDI
jgi:hypothetical protein